MIEAFTVILTAMVMFSAGFLAGVILELWLHR
jgi:hypothetical protein